MRTSKAPSTQELNPSKKQCILDSGSVGVEFEIPNTRTTHDSEVSKSSAKEDLVDDASPTSEPLSVTARGDSSKPSTNKNKNKMNSELVILPFEGRSKTVLNSEAQESPPHQKNRNLQGCIYC